MAELFDVHCHILPNIDDGSKTMKTTRQMLFLAQEEGIRRIIFTPHYHIGHFAKDNIYVKQVFEKVKDRIEDYGLDLEVYLGNELYYHHDLIEHLKDGRANTMAGSSYVLVEFSPSADYHKIRLGMNRLQMAGYIPILAHVERYESLRKNYRCVEELNDMGIYFQANSGAILGQNGLQIKRFLKKLLKEERISLVGTDAHDMEKRAPLMRNCVDYIGKKYGKDYAKLIAWMNPQKIVEDKIIEY